MGVVSDALTSGIGAASRSVARAGLDREINALTAKVKARKEALGMDLFAARRGGLRASLDDVRRGAAGRRGAERAIEKRSAKEALAAAAPPSPPAAAAPPPSQPVVARTRTARDVEGAAARDPALADELARADDLSRAPGPAPDAVDALRRSHGDREAAAALLLDPAGHPGGPGPPWSRST
ncbi:hypothetical protein JL722_13890 [Aureococcus anophagefferens]|nr:hypothetical protein JL722_13890 [Aureococcus anophagefferens]